MCWWGMSRGKLRLFHVSCGVTWPLDAKDPHSPTDPNGTLACLYYVVVLNRRYQLAIACTERECSENYAQREFSVPQTSTENGPSIISCAYVCGFRPK